MRTITLFLLLIATLGLKAQSQQKINLEQAIKLGLEQSKQLKLSESKMATANARLAEYKEMRIPTLNVFVGYDRISDNIKQLPAFDLGFGPVVFNRQILNQGTGKASLTSNVFAGLRVKNGIVSAEYLKKATELDYDKDRSDIVFNIVSAYYNLYKVRESAKLVEENIRLTTERLKETQSQLAQGLAIENDKERSKLQLSNFNLNKLDIANNIKIVNYDMTIMLGLPAETEILPDSADIGSAKELQPFNNYLDAALNNRADVKSTDMRRLSSATNVKVAKAGYYPVISLGANYLLADPNQRVFPPVDKFTGTWDIGASVNYNITGAYTTRRQVQEQQTMLKQTEIQQDLLTDGIKMEINQSYVQYQSALDRIRVSTESVKQAETNYASYQSRYKNEVATLTDLIEAETLLLQSRLNLLYAKADAEIAYNQLLKSTGTNTTTTK